jgi:hypothetical protein
MVFILGMSFDRTYGKGKNAKLLLLRFFLYVYGISHGR